MGLTTALSTSLTGLSAAEAIFDVAGNNVANSNTVGFKASEATFATQFLQTRSLGSSPTTTRGGTNPRQFGLGVSIAEVTPDFTQGTVEVSNNPSDLAIQGDGFFIVQGPQGEQFYTRNGLFKTNAQNELVTVGGHRVLGHVADENFEIQTTTLQALNIPLGAKSVAQATENVFMQGTLTPVGDLADTPEIIQSRILSDGTVEVPADMAAGDISALSPPASQASSANGVSATPPNVAGVTSATSAGGTLPAGTYDYKIVYVDSAGNEGVPSTATTPPVVVADPNNTVTLNNIPLPPAGFVGTRVYRSDPGPAGPYLRVGADLGPTDTTFDDDGLIGSTQLDEGTGLPTSPPGPSHYDYKIVYVDAAGNEGPPESIPGVVDVSTGNRKIHLTNLPTPSAPFVTKRIYRSTTVNSGQPGGPYVRVGSDLAAGAATFSDSGLVGGATLNEQTLAPANYGYYVTFFDSASGLETRPTSKVGPQPVSLNGRRIRLEDIPQPSVGSSFDRVKIYRSLSTDDSEFYEVADLPLGQTVFVDSASDADLLATNNLINLDGPPINPSMNLVDIMMLDVNGTYSSPFEVGELHFEGKKGGQGLEPKMLEITATTTVQDLIVFVEEAMGILKVSPDSTNPLPGNPGGRITVDSRLEFAGNNGVPNALAISAFELTSAGGTDAVNLNFGSTQSAKGVGAATDVIVYDSLGIPIGVRVTAVMEARDSNSTTYRWFADARENDPPSGVQINVGTGLIRFDSEGTVLDVTNSTASVLRSNVASSSPLEFDIDFTNLSGLSTDTSFLSAALQDGSPAGTLSSFIIGEDGRIRGVFSNGVTRDLGQIRLSRFANNSGLEQLGENLFAAGVNSGLPIEGNPGEQGIGTIVAGAKELSNTDIGQNLIDLIVASTQYRGSARVITAAQQLLDELLNIRR